MGAIPHKAVTNRFLPTGGNKTSDAPGVVFDPTIGEEETPLPNDSFKASNSPPVGGRLRSFSRDWQANNCSFNVLNIITNGYVLPFLSKPNLVRFPLILSEYKALPKDQALADCIQSLLSMNTIERVENVKSLGFYSRLFLVPKVEASNRPKQAQHFSTRREVQDGNSRVHQDLPDSRGMGSVDRSIGRLPSHPHPSSLKEIPKILPQVSGVPVHLPTFRTGHSPPGLYHDRKGGEAHGPLQRAQTPPIPGRLADQVSIPGGSPSEHSGSGRSNPVLGMDHQSAKIRTESHSGVFVCGLRAPPRFSPCKTHSREMAQTSGFYPTTQVKTCFDCKMFDVSNWVASLNGENGLRGTTSHEALSVSPQGALEISSTTEQPPSLDRSHLCTPRLVAEPCKRDERLRLSSQRPQYPTLYRRLKRRLGRSLRTKFYPRSVVSSGKRPSHKRPRIESCLSGPETLQRPVSGPNNASCNGQLNCGSLHKQTRRNTLSGDVCTPVENHDLVPSFSYHIESQAHSRVSEYDGRPTFQVKSGTVDRMVTTSTGVQTDLPKVVHSPRGPVCHSSEPQASTVRVSYPRPEGLGHRCSKHRLDGSHCLCLPSNGSPSQGDPKNQTMQLSDHTDSPRLARDALVLGPSAAINRDPTATPGVNNTPQAVPQLRVPQEPAAPQPPRLVSRSGQLQEQGFPVEVAERIAAPQWSSTRTIYKSKWALFEKWCRENSVDFSTPSVKQISDFFMYLYQDLSRRPSTIDGYRTAIVDTLAHWANILLIMRNFIGCSPVSTGIDPKVPEISPSGTFLLFSMSSQKHPLSL